MAAIIMQWCEVLSIYLWLFCIIKCVWCSAAWCDRFGAGKSKNELLSRLSALGVSAHEKELFAGDHQSPEEYANIARAKQVDHDSESFESAEKIKNMLVVRPCCTTCSLKEEHVCFLFLARAFR